MRSLAALFALCWLLAAARAADLRQPVEAGEQPPFQCASEGTISDVDASSGGPSAKQQVLLTFTLHQDDETQGSEELALFDLSGAPKLPDPVDE